MFNRDYFEIIGDAMDEVYAEQREAEATKRKADEALANILRDVEILHQMFDF